jgi:hypothetical protein
MRKLIGHVAVDSGTIMVVDPCYVLSHNGSTIKETYNDMLDAFYPEGQNDEDAPSFVEPWSEGGGICVSTLFGDGLYPVYAEYKHGGKHPSGIFIDFQN